MIKIQKIIYLILIVYLVLPAQAQMPFEKGVNLTNWFQSSSAKEIQFNKFTKRDILNVKSLGCDVIRLPINLHAMTFGAPDYKIDPLFFFFLDQVVDWMEQADIHLILDNHTFDPSVDTKPEVETILLKVWTQMAEHYKDKYENIYYEILNEPHGISDAVWGQIQQRVIDAIRAVDKSHTIIVGPANWNSYHNLKNLPEYKDDNLIYTFHFYDPFIFTHQGASWTGPSMEPLKNIPFPYEENKKPQFPAELKDTWIEDAFNNYAGEGNLDHVKELIDIAVEFKNTRNVPIFCGEFGVYMKNSNNNDRVFWYSEIRKYFKENQIPWTMWDYTGGFGIFEKNSNDLFQYDLNIPLVEALGFNVPDQKTFVREPDSTGFIIYDDFIGNNIVSSNYGDQKVNYYSDIKPNNGKFCLYWSDANQYNQIGFNFKPNKDLSELVDNDYAIDFFVRGNKGSKFDIRFIDTKTREPGDHPWRIRVTIDENAVSWDNRWNHLHIPLKNFTEQGSWDNGWFEPVGAFDWSAIDRFEIVAEHHNLRGNELWFDNLIITNLDTAKVHEKGVLTAVNYSAQNEDINLIAYPNPVNKFIRIIYEISVKGFVELSLFDTLGKKIHTFFEENKAPGQYSEVWYGKNKTGKPLSDGFYLLKIITPSNEKTFKLIVQNN